MKYTTNARWWPSLVWKQFMCVHSFIYSNCTLYVVLEWKIYHEEFATYSTFLFYKSMDMPVPFFPNVPLIISTYRLGSFLPFFRCFQIRIPEKSGVATPPPPESSLWFRRLSLAELSLVERRWSGLCRLWSKPGLHTDWARWGEAAASTHLLQREFSTWAEQEIWNKNYATKEIISSPVLHMNSLNGVSALVGTTSTLVSHMSRDLSRDCVAKHISFFWYRQIRPFANTDEYLKSTML